MAGLCAVHEDGEQTQYVEQLTGFHRKAKKSSIPLPSNQTGKCHLMQACVMYRLATCDLLPDHVCLVHKDIQQSV